MLVTIALGLSAMCIIAIPLSHIFIIMLFLAGIFGGCFGATDTFTTVQLIRMYGKQVRQLKPCSQGISSSSLFLPITPLVVRRERLGTRLGRRKSGHVFHRLGWEQGNSHQNCTEMKSARCVHFKHKFMLMLKGFYVFFLQS